MKILISALVLATSLFGLDITKAVELGIDKNNKIMGTQERLDKAKQADDKLDIRLLYIKFLENREKLALSNAVIKKMENIKGNKEALTLLEKYKKEHEAKFLGVKSLLESVMGKKIKDVKSVEEIDFSVLKNSSLEDIIDKSNEDAEHVNSLEKEIHSKENDKKKSSWSVDVGGEITYGYETGRGYSGRSYDRSDVEVGVSIVLSKNSGSGEETTIETAKRRSELEKKKIGFHDDVKKYREYYLEALKVYKLSKSKINKIDLESLKNSQEIKDAHSAYMDNTKALYSVYESYALLLNIIEKN